MEVQLGPTNRVGVDSSAAADPRYHDPYDLHHRIHSNPHAHADRPGYGSPATMSRTRKRKAESQDNQRLSKRLSLLNLERNGPKLYVPVETPSLNALPEHPVQDNLAQGSASPVTANDGMQLDDTKHKVYIYDLDAELSSADENSESESSLPGSPTSGRGRLVFLPDIEKHLSRSRIPHAVFANKEGDLAGHNINDMQMVLYSEPSSLTVPREHDSVRKAILEARARARQRQKDGQSEAKREPLEPNMVIPVVPSSTPDMRNFSSNNVDMAIDNPSGHHLSRSTTPWHDGLAVDDDVDAMDMD
ncbi:hypothetical protein F5B22DRAFT_492028 [Xylaria bambusicola]|uniref:uncharacterized protein n=1 Tax=Xylaria bambusicola TaxID=326684 RepID=UPI002008DD98|nr:uncharacterized protein F5B22DRAFT_492028 [Xylaria bambusicola]KAI0505798.1 hypothetical protein F5B22DRAFT_492028 [Xylaria bambusicola]